MLDVSAPSRPPQRRGIFVVLFALMLLLHVALQLLREFAKLDLFVGVAFLGVLGLAGWLTLERRGARTAYGAALILSVITTIGRSSGNALLSLVAWQSFHLLFFLAITALVTGWVVRQQRVSINTIFAALSGYYLMGLTWALGYALLDTLAPGSFTLELGDRLQEAFYFSFVTLTTLGYGDISPVAPLARSLVTLEALVGQVYLVVLVARLVSLQIVHES